MSRYGLDFDQRKIGGLGKTRLRCRPLRPNIGIESDGPSGKEEANRDYVGISNISGFRARCAPDA